MVHRPFPLHGRPGKLSHHMPVPLHHVRADC
uniref:Uncharacterized protein n=1 Tax=Arundo donax TaxID=35708 RepID=A0A0A9GWY7_ARUDO